MDSPEVSIVITSYEQGAFVGDSIDSALAQRDAQVEVIVVDDGSSDHGPEIISSYGDSVVAIRQRRAGQGAAWNTGAARARGRWIIFLDGDDRLREGAAAAVLEAGRSRPTPAKIHWPMRLIDHTGASMGLRTPQDRLPGGDRLAELVGFGFDRGPNVATSGNAWSGDFLRRVLPLPAELFRLSPDTLLLGLSPLFGPTTALDGTYSEYRCHSGNNGAKGTARRRAADVLKRSEYVFDRVASALADRGLAARPEHWRRVNPTYRQFAALLQEGESRASPSPVTT